MSRVRGKSGGSADEPVLGSAGCFDWACCGWWLRQVWRSRGPVFHDGLKSMTKPTDNSSLIRAPIAVILAWMVPGLGHIFLGHKIRGVIFLVAITVTFWTGVAIGGVRCVDQYKPIAQSSGARQPQRARSWWFFAQILNGGYAITTYAAKTQVAKAGYLSWPSGDVASVYTGVAGLLNLLIIMDALARAELLPPSGRRRNSNPGTAQTGGGIPGG